MTGRCPHAEIKWCPLYIASHMPAGGGCDDGLLGDHEGCAVARGLDYSKAVGVLRARHPGLVEQIEWRQQIEESKEQRRRNMTMLGLH